MSLFNLRLPHIARSAPVVMLLAATLVGCGDGGVADVREWMEQVRRDTRIAVPKIAKPKQFTPFVYQGKATVDPFSVAKLNSALAKVAAASGNKLKPDLDRRRDVLEGYPLDVLRMVGTLERANLTYGLVQADKLIFQVKIGSYMGQNLGMVTAVSDTAIEIRETVQDATGEWVERRAKLELQETKK